MTPRWTRADAAILATLLALGAQAGCAEALPLQDYVPPTLEEPDAGEADAGADADAPPVDDPGVRIASPVDGDALDVDALRVEGGAEGVASVWVQVGPNAPRLATLRGGVWSIDVDAPRGAFTVRAWGYDGAGVRAPREDAVRVTRAGDVDDSGAPTVAITSPEDGASVGRATALVRGSAQDDRQVVRVEIWRDGEQLTERAVSTDDGFETWARLVPLVPGVDHVVEARAFDALGQEARASIRLSGRAELDRTPPALSITSHADGDTVDVADLALSGTAADASGVREVRARVERALADGTRAWSPWSQGRTDDGWATWGADLPLTPGMLRVEARAIDSSGLATSSVIDLTNVYAPRWSPERLLTLRVREDDPTPTVRATLDRDGLEELVPPAIQDDILLIELDPTALLTNTLTQIKNACGTGWQLDAADPQHDCAQTPLGQTFVGPDGTWNTSAEYALVRLLTMTPANVVVDGTSVAGLRNIADGAILGIRIGGGFNQILSDMLGISRTTEIAPTPAVVESLREGLVASHPNTGPNGELRVTLRDALLDLAPLGTKLGPDGAHPGVLDPASPPSSTIFGPNFALALEADSNLRWLDGLDLSSGKDYMATIVDTTGPTFEDVLEFDFADPSRFSVSGLTAAPTADLRFALAEFDAFIDSCNGSNACQANLPGAPTSPESVWSRPPWELEAIVVQAVYNQYRTRTFDRCYINFLGCQARVAIGRGQDPVGWTFFDIIFNLGNPPRSQYVWELIGEVAQVALHRIPNATIAEGDADVAFTVEDVPVGLTGAQLSEAIRPYLQDQASTISENLLGDWARNNGALDVFWARLGEPTPKLRFIAAADPRPSEDYLWATPGFFSDPELTTKVSAFDGAHESWEPPTGESTVYVEDDTGEVYRLRITRAQGSDELDVALSREVAP